MSAIILPGDVVSSPWGKYYEYEGINEGTIMLWDAGFDAENNVVPGNGAVKTNLVRRRGAGVTGLTEAQMDFSVYNFAGTYLGVERTSKGGIHAAYSQAGGHTAGEASFGFNFSEELKNWIYNNTDAGEDIALMMTLWFRRTRDRTAAVGTAPQALSWVTSGTAATTNYVMYTQGAAVVRGVPVGNAMSANNAVLEAPAMLSGTSQGWAGTKPESGIGAASTTSVMSVGPRGPWTSFERNNAASYAMYRAQVDVLNFSDLPGDLAARNDALSATLASLHAREFGVGGRFYGDTHTPAATLKP